jgi:PAS domain-containing protein
MRLPRQKRPRPKTAFTSVRCKSIEYPPTLITTVFGVDAKLKERKMPGNADSQLAGADHGRLDSAIVAEQIRLLTRKRLDLPINLLNAGIVSAVFWPLYPVWVVLSWLGVFSIVILLRALIRRRYRMAERSPEAARRWARVFVANAFTKGFLWGLTASVILVTPNPVYHLFIVFVLGGMMAGGIVSNSAYMPAMVTFMLPTILPVIAVLMTRHDNMQFEMGVMLAAFAAVLFFAGRNIHQSIIENFRLRIEQDVLLIKLRASEAVLAEAQEMAHMGSWDIDLVAKSYVCSAEAYRIFGVDPGKVRPSYEEMLSRIHPDDRSAVDEDIAATVTSGQGRGIDHRLVMDDGIIKFVHELGRVAYDAKGLPLRMKGTVEDITDRRIAEDKLKFANILLRTEMEASPDGILVVDNNRKIISFNQRFADIWSIPVMDLEAGNDVAILSKVTSTVRDPKRFSERVRYLYDHPGEDSHDEFETADGRVIDRYTQTLISPGNMYLGRVWFFRDITERRQTANELAYRDRLLHAVTVGTGILVKAESLDQGMPEALRIVGECMHVDRVLLLQDGRNHLSAPVLRYIWQMRDIQIPFDMSTLALSAADIGDLTAWRAPMKEGKPVIEQLATSNGGLRTFLEAFKSQSTLNVPIFVRDKLWGNLGIDSARLRETGRRARSTRSRRSGILPDR